MKQSGAQANAQDQRADHSVEPERPSFHDLYARTYEPLVKYCSRYCPKGHDPEDIAQEALARAWSAWDRYSPTYPFWPWVQQIARRLCVDYGRRKAYAKQRTPLLAMLVPTPLSPDELTEKAHTRLALLKALRRIRPDYQRIVALRDIEGWSYEEIARHEAVTVESVRSSLRRARACLRKSYHSQADDRWAAGLGFAGIAAAVRRLRDRLAVRLARWHSSAVDAFAWSGSMGTVFTAMTVLSLATAAGASPAVPALDLAASSLPSA
nr:sigma-70 family RNA polymerase sigma factor [Actinomycetota bacterium]